MLSIDLFFLIKAKTIILITVLFAVSTKLLFIVYKLGTHFTQRSAALLNKRWPLTYKKSGRFITLKAADLLH